VCDLFDEVRPLSGICETVEAFRLTRPSSTFKCDARYLATKRAYASRLSSTRCHQVFQWHIVEVSFIIRTVWQNLHFMRKCMPTHNPLRVHEFHNASRWKDVISGIIAHIEFDVMTCKSYVHWWQRTKPRRNPFINNRDRNLFAHFFDFSIKFSKIWKNWAICAKLYASVFRYVCSKIHNPRGRKNVVSGIIAHIKFDVMTC
jgi:hypothetical protein